MGRSVFTPELAQRICDELATGRSLRQICHDESMPAPSTVILWTRTNPSFAEQYARARDIGMDLLAEEIIAIADDSEHDTVTRYREDGSEYQATDFDHINRSRLRVDARKWYLSKLAPKRYGDQITESGGGHPSIQLVILPAGAELPAQPKQLPPPTVEVESA